MQFDDDVIEAVKDRAPNGLSFDDEEVVAALTKVSERGDFHFYSELTYTNVVERAAALELAARNPKREEPRRTGWLARLGLEHEHGQAVRDGRR